MRSRSVRDTEEQRSLGSAAVSDGPSNAASEFFRNLGALLSGRASPPSEAEVRAALTDDFTYEDRRTGVTFPDCDAESAPKLHVSNWQTGAGEPRWESNPLAVRGERFAALAVRVDYGNGMLGDSVQVVGLDVTLSLVQRLVDFDIEDVDGATAELDRLHSQADAS
jgi:hypothetical protein